MAATVKLPSPPPSQNGDLLQHNLHHLIEHSREHATTLAAFELNERTSSRLGLRCEEDEGPQAACSSYTQGGNDAVSAPYSSYPQKYAPLDSGYSSAPAGYTTRYDTPGDSPQSSYPNPEDVSLVRSANLVSQEARTTPRVLKPPRMRKGRNNKAKSDKAPKLDKPLSELTKDWTHIPVVDIEAYVMRSSEERQREVEESKTGKVKRPMNSFMLYRKAFQNRTKDWCLRNNHQVVSQLCGESWPMEPDSIREQFNEWAKIERTNHQLAHPGYKFSPSKPGGAAKSLKRQHSDDSLSEESDLDDFDWEKGQSRRPRKQRRSTPWSMASSPSQFRQSETMSREATPLFHSDYTSSPYQHSSLARLVPEQYGPTDLQQGQHYQQTVYRNPIVNGVEDIMIRKTVVPGATHYLSGYPASDQGVVPSLHGWESHIAVPESRIDPSLMQAGAPHLYLDSFGTQVSCTLATNFTEPQDWQVREEFTVKDPHGQIMLSQAHDSLQASEQDLHMLKGNQEGWQVEYMDNHEFDKWMDGH